MSRNTRTVRTGSYSPHRREGRFGVPPSTALRISSSKPTVGASARTLYYGLYPPEDASSDWPLQEHLQAYLDVVLGRVKRDIESWMDESADQRRFVTI